MTNAADPAWLDGVGQIVSDLRIDGAEITSTDSSIKARRSRHEDGEDRVKMAIVERDGIISLEDQSWEAFAAGKTRMEGDSRIRAGTTLGTPLELERLPPSQIYKALEKADRKLTPMASDGASLTGLRSWANGRFKPEKQARADGRILLIVHGTFSNCDNILESFQKTAEGQDFLKQALTKYHQILVFDHRTLGVSPILNANQLANFLDNSVAEVDIICHSRGGLVSRWWAEVFDKNLSRKTRIVFVASPMDGTSLASPHNIRESMNLLANYSRVAGVAAGAIPMFTVATVLFQTISSITRVMAKTPVADAAIALIPGIDAMSRVGNNHELLALQKDVPTRAGHRYFAIKSNFEPKAVGWKFWKVARNGKDRIKAVAADFVFQADNDLVVDTASMLHIPQLEDTNICDFGTSDKVHHTNYFEQPETIVFLTQRLLKELPNV